MYERRAFFSRRLSVILETEAAQDGPLIAPSHKLP